MVKCSYINLTEDNTLNYTYKISRLTDIEKAEKARIANNNWNMKSVPEVYFQAAFDGENLIVEMTCLESNPLTRYTKNYDPVYLDSCMECFLCLSPEESERYVNIETNSSGAVICSVGNGRNDRESVLEKYGILPQVTVTKKDDRWSVLVVLTPEFTTAVFGKALSVGSRFTGNFYKCEQDSDNPNFLSWTEITTEKPDFHRPEFFGELHIAD